MKAGYQGARGKPWALLVGQAGCNGARLDPDPAPLAVELPATHHNFQLTTLLLPFCGHVAGLELPKELPATHAWVERVLARPAMRCAPRCTGAAAALHGHSAWRHMAEPSARLAPAGQRGGALLTPALQAAAPAIGPCAGAACACRTPTPSSRLVPRRRPRWRGCAPSWRRWVWSRCRARRRAGFWWRSERASSGPRGDTR